MNDEELRDHRGFVILEFQIFAKSLKKIPYRRAAQLCFILGWNGLKPILHSISTGEKEIGFPSVFFLKTPHHQKHFFRPCSLSSFLLFRYCKRQFCR